jgi:hypothetical protein
MVESFVKSAERVLERPPGNAREGDEQDSDRDK